MGGGGGGKRMGRREIEGKRKEVNYMNSKEVLFSRP